MAVIPEGSEAFAGLEILLNDGEFSLLRQRAKDMPQILDIAIG